MQLLNACRPPQRSSHLSRHLVLEKLTPNIDIRIDEKSSAVLAKKDQFPMKTLTSVINTFSHIQRDLLIKVHPNVSQTVCHSFALSLKFLFYSLAVTISPWCVYLCVSVFFSSFDVIFITLSDNSEASKEIFLLYVE